MSDTDGQPGGLGGLDACGDSQIDDVFYTLSNFGADIDIAAPGVCVESTFSGGLYGHGSGTSLAAPVVSGTVALCIASGPCTGLTPAQIIQKIVADAAAYNNSHPEYGFAGDPLRPVEGKYYGYLIRAALY
jgi:subtilisin family serine protease